MASSSTSGTPWRTKMMRSGPSGQGWVLLRPLGGCTRAWSGTQTRLDVAATRGLTPVVGREQEVGVLAECWERATAGMGQVVVLMGEAGIGKSRLVQVFREQIAGPAATPIECRCSPQTQHS